MLSLLPKNGNQDITHETTYTTEIMLELYYIKELSEGTLPLSFNLIYHYQQEDPFLTEKLKCATYQKFLFRGGRNTI